MKNTISLIFIGLFFLLSYSQETSSVDLIALSSHPHLKYLGKSLYDPEVQELLKNKKVYIEFNESINSEYIGVEYSFYSRSKLINRIRFSTVKGRNVVKYKGLKNLPKGINSVKIEPTAGGIYYRLQGEDFSKLYDKSLDTYLSFQLAKRKNNPKKYLIKTREDLERYYDPKGDDIITLLDTPDTFFDEYVSSKGGNLKYKRTNCYFSTFKVDEIILKKCRPKGKDFDKVYYSIEANDFSNKEFKERFPYSVDLDKGMDVVLAQLAEVEGFKEAVRMNTFSEDKYIGKEEIAVEITVVKIETKGIMRYVILKRKVTDLEYDFYSISISNHNFNGYLGNFKPIKINTLEANFIKTEEDLARFYDPKGEDILTLIDSPHNKVFEEYLVDIGVKVDRENGYTITLKQDEIKLRRFPLMYSITSLDFANKKFKDRFPYNIDLSEGVYSVTSQLTKKNLVENIDEGRANTVITINDTGKKRYIHLIGFPLESEDSFHTIVISNTHPWSNDKITYQSVADYKKFKSVKRRIEFDALKKDGIYHPIDGSEAITVGVPLMTFKIRKDKTVEVVEIDVNIVEKPASILRYWRSKVLKSINGVPMVNMDSEKLIKACQGEIGDPIVIINEEGLAYKPKREYWLYGDYKTIDFDTLFPNREQGVSEGSFTWKGYTYTGEYINGREARKLPRGNGVWQGKKAKFQGVWLGEPEGVFTVTDNSNSSKYAVGTFKNGIPIGKWNIHDPENSYITNFEIVFNSNGKLIKTPDMAEVSTKLEKSSEDKRTVIYFSLIQLEQYSAMKLIYSLGYLTGDCECKNESTAATLNYTEYYKNNTGEKVYSFFPSAICAEFKSGHITNISEAELNWAIDQEIYKLWKIDFNSTDLISDAVNKSDFTGRQSKSFSKIYAPSVGIDCTTEKEVKVVSWKDYDIWFLWE